MGEDVEALKPRVPLLDYLQQHSWIGWPAGRGEYVGLCPLHEETRPSFYVNTRKDVFYCHGCGEGGDLLRFLQLARRVSFPQASPAWIRRLVHKLMRPRCSNRRPPSVSSSWIPIPRRWAICANVDFTIRL